MFLGHKLSIENVSNSTGIYNKKVVFDEWEWQDETMYLDVIDKWYQRMKWEMIPMSKWTF